MSAQTVAPSAVHVAWCREHVDEGEALVMCRQSTGVVETVSHRHPLHVVAARWDMAPDPDDEGDAGEVDHLVELSPDGRWVNAGGGAMDVLSLRPAEARALATALLAAADLLDPAATRRRGQGRGAR